MLPNGWTPPPSLAEEQAGEDIQGMHVDMNEGTISEPLTSPYLSSVISSGEGENAPDVESLPFKVLRTSRGFLPVYTDFRWVYRLCI